MSGVNTYQLYLDIDDLKIVISLDETCSVLFEYLECMWQSHTIHERCLDLRKFITVSVGVLDRCDINTRIFESKEAAAYAISQRVTRELIAAKCGSRILLHASAIANSRGDVTALVGPSGSGKSTAAKILSSKMEYISDETLVWDPRRNRVSPYRKPISLIVKGVKGDFQIPSKLLGCGPYALHCIAFPRRLDNTPPRLERISFSDGVNLLASQSSSLWSFPEALLHLHDLYRRSGGFISMHYSEFEDVQDLIYSEKHPTPVRATPFRHLSRELYLKNVATTVEGASYHLKEFADAAFCDDGVTVLRAGGMVRIDGPGSAVWCILYDNPFSNFQSIRCLAGIASGITPSEAQLRNALDRLMSAGLVAT